LHSGRGGGVYRVTGSKGWSVTPSEEPSTTNRFWTELSEKKY